MEMCLLISRFPLTVSSACTLISGGPAEVGHGRSVRFVPAQCEAVIDKVGDVWHRESRG